MSYDAQQFEQIMTTVFTCRSVVKYNLVLNEEQKSDLLADIDSALEMLRSYLITGPAPETSTARPSLPQAGPPTTPTSSLLAVSIPKNEPAHGEREAQTLQALYKMYYAYLDMKQNPNINTFVTRFNDVMSAINDMQQTVENSYGRYDAYARDASLEESLQHIKMFITDLYTMFMEFIRVLSEVLQQNNVQLDTEKLSSMQNEALHVEKRLTQRDLLPLLHIYEAQRQLNARRGYIVNRVNDATALLEFLKESLHPATHKREEIVMQVYNVTKLLHELSRFLTDYERAISSLLTQM